MTKLYSRNLGGNIHTSVTWINDHGLADFVIHMESSGYNTIIVFRMTEEQRASFERCF